jgi:hypothetical protein
MLHTAQMIGIGAVLMAVLSACATVAVDAPVASAAGQPISASEAVDLAMARNYAALHSPGNWWSAFVDDEDVDINKYEHYAVVKSPGSVYDSSWYSIEVFRSPYSVPIKSEATDNPKYYIRVHHTGAWEASGEQSRERENAQRVIYAMQQSIDQSSFADFRDRVSVDRFVQASRNEDDGKSTTHLNVYSFDMTRGAKRDLVTVGWEGFDRFGDLASTLDVFIEFAVERFPELVAKGALQFSAPSSSTHKVE